LTDCCWIARTQIAWASRLPATMGVRSSPWSPSLRRTRDLVALAGFLSLGVALGLTAATSLQAKVDPQVHAFYLEGRRLQEAHQIDEAVTRYEAGLAINPDHVETLYELGWSYYVLGRWDQVLAVWGRVVQLAPESDLATALERYLPDAQREFDALEDRRKRRRDKRMEATAALRKMRIRFALAGDTMLGSPTTEAGLPPEAGRTLLGPFADAMRSADVAFLNLEGVFLDDGTSRKCRRSSAEDCRAFRSPVRFAEILVGAGIDFVSLANDHANDFGARGRNATQDVLRRAGIAFSGSIGQVGTIDRRGQRVGFIAFSTSKGHYDMRDLETASLVVRAMDQRADLLVVSFHGGREGEGAERTPANSELFRPGVEGDVRAFSHAVIDAGADLVVGHGPHVLRGLEVYRDRLIAYSLGNFITYGGFDLSGARGLSTLLEVELDGVGAFQEGRLLAGRQEEPGGGVRALSSEAATRLAKLSRADFGAAAPRISRDGGIVPSGEVSP